MGDEMEGLLGLAGLLLAGAATPGPNNLVVWHVAARRGFSGALPAIAGVVLGGLALLAAAMAGLDALLGAVPWLRSALLVAGCVYLAWLGITLIVRAGHGGTDAGPGRLPEGFAGLFVFQFLNPKGWVLMATVAAALPVPPDAAAHAGAAALFLCISSACLGMWALMGRAVARGTGSLSRLERLMGCLLIVSAALLAFGR